MVEGNSFSFFTFTRFDLILTRCISDALRMKPIISSFVSLRIIFYRLHVGESFLFVPVAYASLNHGLPVRVSVWIEETASGIRHGNGDWWNLLVYSFSPVLFLQLRSFLFEYSKSRFFATLAMLIRFCS
jgi:hypothetical protein